MKSSYTAALIKPDAHRDVIAEMITRDLQERDFDVIFRKDTVLTREQAEKIYAEHKGSQNFEQAVKSLLGTEKNKYSTVLILKLLKEDDIDILVKAKEIRGKSNEGGIRFKYRILSEQELKEKGYEGEELKNELSKNRLHIPDSTHRALEMIDLLLNENEKLDLKEREPQLYHELRELKENKESGRELIEYKKFK